VAAEFSTYIEPMFPASPTTIPAMMRTGPRRRSHRVGSTQSMVPSPLFKRKRLGGRQHPKTDIHGGCQANSASLSYSTGPAMSK
jgi:hypothetical protein